MSASRYDVYLVAGARAKHFVIQALGLSPHRRLGALDTFLLEKLIGGWKPNRFIDKNLRPLLEEADDSRR